MMNRIRGHRRDVENLQKAVVSIDSLVSCKQNNSNTLRNGNYKKGTYSLNLDSLTRIVQINVEEGWIKVEPRVTIRKLTSATLKYNLIPPVVPEFASITVGGAIMGTAIESSSHQYGLFFDTCLECELLLGNGQLVTASPQENPDLFYGISGSYGSVALLMLAKIRLIPAKPYVLLTCNTFSNREALSDTLTKRHFCDFVEGILYSPHEGAAILGSMVHEVPQGAFFLRHKFWWDRWYVDQIEGLKHRHFYMSLQDYLFRFDRGCFWIGRSIYSFRLLLRLLLHYRRAKTSHLIRKIHEKEANFLFRLLFGWNFSSWRLYQIWHSVPSSISENLFFIQDFFAPLPVFNEALKALTQKTGIFPVWLCPVKGTFTPQFLAPHFGKHRFINIGLYGIPPFSNSLPALTEELEEMITTFEGRKMLYSFTYFTPERFYDLYGKGRYLTLRKKYYADAKFAPIDKKFRS